MLKLLNKLSAFIYLIRRRYLNEREFILILSLIIGFFGGLVALILKYGVFYFHKLLNIELRENTGNYYLLLIPMLGIIITVFLKDFILRDTVKHNIAAILQSISKRNSFLEKHKIFSSVIGGILTAGFGGSVGLEAPIISSGAAIGSNIGRFFKLNYKTITLLLACGAVGAISAIFHTPIAAIVFALEVLMIDLSRFTLIPLLIASVSGAIVTNVFYGESMLFNFTLETSFSVSEIPFFILFGIITGFVSIYFAKSFVHIESRFEKIHSTRKQILIGGVLIGLLIFLFPPLLSEGFHTVRAIIQQDYNWVFQTSILSQISPSFWMMIIFFILLILLKVVATAITIGSGGVGGVFAPSLFTGAITGLLFAKLMAFIFPESYFSEVNYALIGMAGILAGVIHAPLTSIFLIIEMTTEYRMIVPLMITSTISFLTVKYFQPNSIFTIQLAKRGELITHHKDKAILTFMELKSVIETDLKTIHIDATLGDLVKVISQSKRNLFPVIDSEEHFHGVVLIENIRSIMFKQEMYNTSIRSLMVIPPETIYSRDSMDMVMKKFERSGAWNLPVVKAGKYMGYVSRSKLFNAYRKLLLEISDE